MSSNLLQIGQAIAIKAGLPSPTSLIGSHERTDQAILQAIKDGTHKDVFRDVDWSFLTVSYSFETTGRKYYVLPEFIDRIVNDTIWDETNSRKLIGPVGPEKWQMYYYGLSSPSGTNRICRLLGPARGQSSISEDATNDEIIVDSDAAAIPVNNLLRRIQIHPDALDPTGVDPNAAEDPIRITFLYITNQYILHPVVGGTTFGQEWLSNTDTCLFDDDVIEAAALWRLLRILGMSYADEREEYNALVLERGSHDGGAETLSLLQSGSMFELNIPDTGFGS